MFEVSIKNPSTYRNHRRGDCHWLHSRPGAEVRRSSSALHSRVSFVNSQLSFFSSTSTVPASTVLPGNLSAFKDITLRLMPVRKRKGNETAEASVSSSASSSQVNIPESTLLKAADERLGTLTKKKACF